MSYLYPANDAVTAQFVAGFTYSSNTAVTASFAGSVPESTHGALGFTVAQFGTPRIAQGGVHSGQSATAFGVPILLGFDQVQQATGVVHGAVGVPENYFAPQVAEQIISVPLTVFGTPVRLYWDQKLLADGLSAKFGRHFGYTFIPAQYNTLAAAQSVLPVLFGSPASTYDQTLVAQGQYATVFGTPERSRHFVSGLRSTLFGPAAAAAFDQAKPALSLRATKFGAHTAVRDAVCSAKSFSASRFGAPVEPTHRAAPVNQTRFGTHVGQGARHRTFGAARTWFGNPAMFRGALCNAVGSSMGGFGVAQAQFTYRARHIPPAARFGGHLLRRGI